VSQLYMLDTNTISYIVKGRSMAARQSMSALQHSVCVSTVVEAELRYGLAKRPEATALRMATETFLRSVMILDWGSAEAVVYGHLRAKQEASGQSLDYFDLMIAAHAIASQSILVSSDKVFRQVDDLPGLVDWATDL
jgi:tRNA(fMet)-specific endonuclease VapC